MKYYTWKMKWSVNLETGKEEGLDPTSFSDESGLTFVAGFRTKDAADKSSVAYGISETEIDVTNWSDYLMEETTATETLNAAKELNSEASLDSNGVIVFPVLD